MIRPPIRATLSISAMQEARALAVLGDAVAVDRKLIDADQAEDQTHEREQDRPPWLYYHSPGFFDVQRGRAWLHLGVHDPARNRRAVDALADGIAQLDEIARGSEWGASSLLYLARAYMQAGDAEQACVVAMDAAAYARRLRLLAARRGAAAAPPAGAAVARVSRCGGARRGDTLTGTCANACDAPPGPDRAGHRLRSAYLGGSRGVSLSVSAWRMMPAVPSSGRPWKCR